MHFKAFFSANNILSSSLFMPLFAGWFCIGSGYILYVFQCCLSTVARSQLIKLALILSVFYGFLSLNWIECLPKIAKQQPSTKDEYSIVN